MKIKNFLLSPGRIKTLTDGLFAIVMTLLVLDIKIDHTPHVSANLELTDTLINLLPRMEIYTVSFFILGLFWVSHHTQFHFIKEIDLKCLWINISFLMFVSILPFSIDLIGEFFDFRLAVLIFGINLLIVNIFLLINWKYATNNHRLVDDDLSQELINANLKKDLISTIIFIAAIIVAHLSIHLSFLFYITIPFIHWKYSKVSHEYEKNGDDYQLSTDS